MAVVGIDLGTTNTVVAAVRDGRATTLKDKLGRALLPSVVSFTPNGGTKVGYEAKDRRTIDPENTVFSIKRLIGRAFDSEHVKKARGRFPFDLKEGPGKATLVSTYGVDRSLPEISALVLQAAQQIAEARLGCAVTDAVITVPANFNDLQRAATKVAGRTAGLDVLRIINEPTAAALAYGFGKTGRERIAVYDFGGGTFDVTILDLSENVFEVLATAGDTFLGGDDIDNAIMDRMAEELLRTKKVDAGADNLVREQLRAAAEKLKIDLSTRSMGKTRIDELDFEFTLRRSDFEAMTEPLLEKTLLVCQEAMDIAGVAPKDLDQILLVGGSTRIPLVRRRTSSFFGKVPQSRINPDEVVAIGAAIQASSLEAKQGNVGATGIPAAPRPRTVGSAHPSRAPASPAERGTGTTQTGLAGLKSVSPGAAPEATLFSGMKSVPPALGTGPGKRQHPAPTLTGVGPFASPSAHPSSPPVAGLPGAPRKLHKTLAGVGLDQPDPGAGPAPRPGQTLLGVSDEVARAKANTLAGLSDRPKQRTNLGLGSAPSSPPPFGRPEPFRDDSFDDVTSVNLGAAAIAARLDDEVGRTKQATIPGVAEPSLPIAPEDYEDSDGSVTFDLAALEAAESPSDSGGFASLDDETTQIVDPRRVEAQAVALDRTADRPMFPRDLEPEPEELGGSALTLLEDTDLPEVMSDLPSLQSKEDEPLAWDGSGLLAVVDSDLPGGEELDLPEPVSRRPKFEVDLPAPRRAVGLLATQVGLPARAVQLPSLKQSVELDDFEEVGLPLVGAAARRAGARRTSEEAHALALDATFVAAPTSGGGLDFEAARARAATPSLEELDELSVAALLPSDEDAGGQELNFAGAGLQSLSGQLNPSTQSLGSPSPASRSDGGVDGGVTIGRPAPAMPAPPLYSSTLLAPASPAPNPSPPYRPSSPPDIATHSSRPAPALPLRGPLLIDVTPLSLGVEVTGGYVDQIISRNSPVPCEMERTFATSLDNQQIVRVRVSQGEERRFDRNTLLGEVELTGITPGPRGSAKITVSFSLDESGMLQVSARDNATGRAANARLMLVGVASGQS